MSINLYLLFSYFIFSATVLFFFIKHGSLFDNLFRKKGIILIFDFFVAFSLILSFPGMLIFAIFYKGATFIFQIGGKKNLSSYKRIKPHGILNAGYFKLFLKLSGDKDIKSDSQLDRLKEAFEKYEFFAITLLFNDEDLPPLLQSGLGLSQSKVVMPVFIPYRSEPVYDQEQNILKVHKDFSNSNYSIKSERMELCGAAFSNFLNLPLDGENKLIVVDKKKPNEFWWIPINLVKNKNLFTLLEFGNHIKRNDTVYNSMVYFLSIFWRNSKLEINTSLKEIAKTKYSILTEELKKRNEYDIINLLKLLTYKKPESNIFFQLAPESPEKIKQKESIKSKIFSTSKEDLLNEFPDFSESDINWIKKQEIQANIKSLLQKKIDYSSKVFLSTAILVREAISNEFLKKDQDPEFDYSGIGISYSKFLEGELNTSLVQLIRSKLGVSMPNYFLKYCDIPGNYIVEGTYNFKVNFNNGNKMTGQYFAPGLGQSIISAEILKKDLESKLKSLDELIELGRKFKKLRNLTAHPELVNSDTLSEMEEIMVQINLKGILDDLIQLRECLKLESN